MKLYFKHRLILPTMTTEAKYQAEITAVVTRVFPYLVHGDYEIEKTFTVRIGRDMVTLSGRDYKTGRADILLQKDGRSLAVIELKKPGAALTAADGAQGLSYARLLNPMAPLVIVAAGKTLRFIDTFTGKAWTPAGDVVTESELAKRFAAAADVAAEDRAKAIATLLGPDSAAWTSLLDKVSQETIDDLSGAFADTLRPFVPQFLIPRIATRNVQRKIGHGHRLTFVMGEPLSGKSHVLRELAELGRDRDDMAVLYVEADGRTEGLYQKIATRLDAELGWPATRDEVRRWLRDLSNGAGPRLVIAVDGLPRNPDLLLSEVEELVTAPFGPGVVVVMALSPEQANELRLDSLGAKATSLGRHSTETVVGPLSEAEVNAAAAVLRDNRLILTPGFEHCREYRTPWVLRAVMGEITSDPMHADTSLAASGRAVMGLSLFTFADRKYPLNSELATSYRALADALLKDRKKAARSPDLTLEGLSVFLVARKVARDHVAAEDLAALKSSGALAEAVVDGVKVFVPRLPELMAREMARAVGERLRKKLNKEPENAAAWLIAKTANLPMGELIAARAILYAAAKGKALPAELIEGLLSVPPYRETLTPGMVMAARMPGGVIVNLTVQEGGKMKVEIGDHSEVIDHEEEQTSYVDVESYSVLAYLASMPMGLFQGEAMVERADPAILWQVASAQVPLYRPAHDMLPTAVLTHDIGAASVISGQSGIVEPITQALYDFLGRNDDEAEPWLERVAADGNLPLLTRVHTALKVLSELTGLGVADWAQTQLKVRILPALKARLTIDMDKALPSS